MCGDVKKERLTPKARAEMKKKFAFSEGRSCNRKKYHIKNVVTGERMLGEKYCNSLESPSWMQTGNPLECRWDADHDHFQRGLVDPQGHDKATRRSKHWPT